MKTLKCVKCKNKTFLIMRKRNYASSSILFIECTKCKGQYESYTDEHGILKVEALTVGGKRLNKRI